MSTATATATVLKLAPGKEEQGLGEQDSLSEGELRAWRGLLRAHASLAKRVDAELERAHGLPLSSYEVLHHLIDAPAGRCACATSPSTPSSRAAASRAWSTAWSATSCSALLLRTRRPRRLRLPHRHGPRAPAGRTRHPPGGCARALPLPLLRARARGARPDVGAHGRQLLRGLLSSGVSSRSAAPAGRAGLAPVQRGCPSPAVSCVGFASAVSACARRWRICATTNTPIATRTATTP